MAYPDPQELGYGNVVSAVEPDQQLARTGSAISSGKFSTQDSAFTLTISHQYATRTRRVARLDYKTLVPNPMLDGSNIAEKIATYLVFDEPSTSGQDFSTRLYMVDYLVGWLGGNGFENAKRLLGGES